MPNGKERKKESLALIQAQKKKGGVFPARGRGRLLQRRGCVLALPKVAWKKTTKWDRLVAYKKKKSVPPGKIKEEGGGAFPWVFIRGEDFFVRKTGCRQKGKKRGEKALRTGKPIEPGRRGRDRSSTEEEGDLNNALQGKRGTISKKFQRGEKGVCLIGGGEKKALLERVRLHAG